MNKGLQRAFSQFVVVMLLVGIVPTSVLAQEMTVSNGEVSKAGHENVVDAGKEDWDPLTCIVTVSATEAQTATEPTDPAVISPTSTETLTTAGEGDFEYTDSQGGVSITKYTGSGGAVVIPDTLGGLTVVSIGDWAFFGCSGLTSISVPNSVTTIGVTAFGECSGLRSITFSTGLIAIDDYAFLNCSGLTSITIPNGVTTIGDYVFSGCYRLTSILIPNSVTSIGVSAFSYCSELTSIIIPTGVTAISDYSFLNCEGLTSITIPDSVTTIGQQAFNNCNGLTSITIPKDVITIGDGAFWGCFGLTSIMIPERVTAIGDRVFSNCYRLTSISVSDKNKNYMTNDGILYDKTMTTLIQCPISKTKVTIPTSVTTIGNDAFWGCRVLAEIIIPDNVTSIGENAFEYCTMMSSIRLSKNISHLETNPFSRCDQLMNINVDEGNVNYSSQDGVLYNKTKTTLIGFPGGKNSITIPGSVTSIGEKAFYGCNNLTSIAIPKGVTGIGNFAFLVCENLTTIDISESVTSLGHTALSRCPKLDKVIMRANTTDFDFGVFLESPLVTIYGIPGSDSEIYAEANNIPFVVLNDIPTIATLQSIAITSPATKLTYQMGDALDLAGLVVTGTYSDGITKTETITGVNVTGFDSSKPAASQVLTITINGKTATYTVKIMAGEEPEKGKLTAFLGQDPAGNYYFYNKADFSNSYLAYQINASLPSSKMYQQFLNSQCKIVALEDQTKGYMDYQAASNASLLAQMKGETFNLLLYFARDDADLYGETVTNLKIVDKNGTISE